MRKHFSKRKRGQALVVAIMALTLLTAAAIAVSAGARLELRAAQRGVEQVRREAALRGQVNRGLALLEGARQDPRSMLALLRRQGELQWEPEPAASGDPDAAPLQAALQLVDASARLNLNVAGSDQFKKLPGIQQDTIDGLTGWRNEKNEQDDKLYGQGPRPYGTKRRPYDTLEELLQVRDVDARQFFGEPLVARAQGLRVPPLSELLTPLSGEQNASLSGDARINVNSGSSEELLRSAELVGAQITAPQVEGLITQRAQQDNPFQSVTQALQSANIATDQWGKLLDVWTADRRAFLPGRVNVNTAPALVLGAVPGLSGEMVQTLIRRRHERPDGLTWSEVLEVLGAAKPQGEAGNQQQQQQQDFSQVEKWLCVRSAVYYVRCLVRDGASRRVDAASALVYLPASPAESAQIVQWRQPQKYPGWTAWYRTPSEEEGL